LRYKLVEALTSGAAVPEPRLGVVAAYFPLASLSEADLLFKLQKALPMRTPDQADTPYTTTCQDNASNGCSDSPF